MTVMSFVNETPLGDTSSLAPLPFDQYALIIDARSPHEYAEDHVPGAINLPVVDDAEFAEVGIQHKTDPHAAYLIGREFFPHLITGPFHDGLGVAFGFAIAACVIGAIASMLTSRPCRMAASPSCRRLRARSGWSRASCPQGWRSRDVPSCRRLPRSRHRRCSRT